MVRLLARTAALRDKVMQIWPQECAVCRRSIFDSDGNLECEIAHVRDVHLDGVDQIANALPLCRTHHWAFDRRLWAIELSALKVRVTRSAKQYLKEIDGRQIRRPSPVNDIRPLAKQYLEWRWAHFRVSTRVDHKISMCCLIDVALCKIELWGASVVDIGNALLIECQVPGERADWDTIMRFALTIDGYKAVGIKRLQVLANVSRDHGQLPDDLTALRACLFFEQRRWRYLGTAPDRKGMRHVRALVRAIRRHVVGASAQATRKRKKLPRTR